MARVYRSCRLALCVATVVACLSVFSSGSQLVRSPLKHANVAVSGECPADDDIGTTISFQCHSCNHLEEWTTMFKKGMDSVKMDPHYVDDLSFCKAQGVAFDHSADGCFLFNHDDPVPEARYSTMGQLLQYIAAPENRFHFQNESPMRIAFCFKPEGIDPCSGTEQAKHWVNLVDKFYDTVQATIKDHNLNLDFVLDGAGKPKACTLDKWRPWTSVWIGDPDGAQYSDDISKGFDRYQVLNYSDNKDKWNAIAAEGFAKFGKSSFPMQLWEPDSQQNFEDFSDIYISGGVFHKPGFDFAINIDPAMFQVYTSSRTSHGWHVSATAGSLNPRTAQAGDNLLVAFTDSTTSLLAYVSSPVNTVHGSLKFSDSRTLPPFTSEGNLRSTPALMAPLVSFKTFRTSLTAAPVVIASDGAAVGLFKVAADGSLAAYKSATIDVPEGETVLDIAVTVDGTHTVVMTKSGSSKCPVKLRVLFKNGIEFENGVAVKLPSDFMCATGIDATTVGQGSIVVTGVAPVTSDHLCPKGTAEVFAFFDQDSVVYAGRACVPVDGARKPGVPITTEFHASPFGVGVAPQVAIADIQGVPMMLQVQGESYCDNNHGHNTRANPTMCDQVPASTPKVLVYNYGTVADFRFHLTSEKQGGYVTSCHQDILHGAYDIGTWPSVALFESVDCSGRAAVGMAAVHEGLRADEKDVGDCGLANVMDGHTMVDAFPLPLLE